VKAADLKNNCGVCGDSAEYDDDGTSWIECEKCGHWFHSDCVGIDLDEEEEKSFFFECDK
jgi:hypothetical protein